ncbi:MAG: BatD family protein, partial [Candidatus Thiodiazotropha sp.]
PANPASSPWLPLEQLDLQVTLPRQLKAAAGKPLRMRVELTASGMDGNRLPSLESQLKSDAFRVYRDRSQVETSLNRNNHKIVGRRSEQFTLVPQYGGDLSLPPLSINWWNTRSDSPQRTSYPMQPIAVTGASRPDSFFNSDEESTLFLTGASSAFWIPLSIVFGVIFGYWLAIWISHRRKGASGASSPLQPLVAFLQRPMREMAPAFSPLKERLRTTGRILNPITRWHRWRRHLVGMLPLSLANKHMGLPLNAPYIVIGKHILDFHPKAQPQQIRSLIHELEESIYGHQPLDFERWKEAFKHEIRPSIRLWPRRSTDKKPQSHTNLPNLNPGSAIGN